MHQIAAQKSSMGRMIAQTLASSMKTKFSRKNIKESKFNMNLIYNDQIDAIKEKEKPDKVIVKLGRNKDPAPIELSLIEKFAKLDKKKSKLLDKESKGGVDFSLFTARYPLPQTPKLAMKKKEKPKITMTEI